MKHRNVLKSRFLGDKRLVHKNGTQFKNPISPYMMGTPKYPVTLTPENAEEVFASMVTLIREL